MAEETPLFLIHLLGFAGFLWHGLYVLTRGERDRVSRLTGLTALVTGGLFLTGGIEEALHGYAMVQRVAFARIDWSFSVVPAALWLHLSLRLNQRALHAPWRRPVIYAAYGAAVVLCLLGTLTDIIRTYDHRGNLDPAGPLYVLYVAFVFACAGFAVVNLAQMRVIQTSIRDPQVPASHAATSSDLAESAQVGGTEALMLVVGAVCFLCGVGYFSVLVLTNHQAPSREAPAWALLLIGLGSVGGTVGVQSNLLLGKDMRRDFLYSATGLLALLVPFLLVTGALIGYDSFRTRVLALLLSALIVLGHTLYDTGRDWLDKVFFSPVVQEERAAARAYVEALATPPIGTNPDLATQKQFDDAVRRALTHLVDPTKLATSPLLSLRTVAQGVAEQQLEDNRLTRAAVLKDILVELLEVLKPNDRAGGIAGDAYRFYNCLYYPYVRGVGRRRAAAVCRQLQERRQRDGGARTDLERVAEWLLAVDEDTFYKWQRRGSDTIAAALRERERTSGGTVPDEGRAPSLQARGVPAGTTALAGEAGEL